MKLFALAENKVLKRICVKVIIKVPDPWIYNVITINFSRLTLSISIDQY